MILVIDAGNTRIKWGLHDGQVWQSHGQCPLGETGAFSDALDQLPTPGKIMLSNVAGSQVQATLDHALARYPVKVQRALARASQCGVRNGYATPGQLGMDRWAALIGAHHSPCNAALVINAGTAITVDALHQGVFPGGIILPGYRMMSHMLQQGTSGLAVAPGKLRVWPDNTADALESGRLLAITGAVLHLREQFCKLAGNPPELIISGGDATTLARHLPQPQRVVENLVLEGLRIIAREDRS